jgi:hypothetical protein
MSHSVFFICLFQVIHPKFGYSRPTSLNELEFDSASDVDGFKSILDKMAADEQGRFTG